MSSTPPIVALLPGSTRADSLHRRLAAAMADGLVERRVQVDLVDLNEHPMPIYHGDDEAVAGPPPGALALHDRVAACDGLIILTPEYNGGPSPLLKNAIDWVTRVDRATLRQPLLGLAATSPGRRGGAHGLAVMRAIAEHMRLAIVDTDFSVPEGRFTPVERSWRLADTSEADRLDRWLDSFVEQAIARRATRSAIESASESAGDRAGVEGGIGR